MIEHIKSIVLFLLVAFSLLLTLALWTYQPQLEPVEQANLLEETKLDGEERSITEIIYPKKILFHRYNYHKQYKDKREEIDFYKEILEWNFASINSYLTSSQNLGMRYMKWSEPSGWERNNQTQSLEIQYPIDVPMNLINQIFKVNKGESSWNQSFNKVYFYLYHSNQEIQVIFASDHHSEVLLGEIQSSKAYQRLEDLLSNETSMVHLKEYEFGEGNTFYLPTQELGMENHTLLTDHLSIEPLRNVLFTNPSLVKQTSSRTINGSTYETDGTRALMRYPVFRNDEMIEFVNLLSTEQELTSTEEIIRRSVEFTNDHRGWTDDYKVDEIKDIEGIIEYRMYYDGFPIFDSNQITEMVQQWRNNELSKLKRPLFQMSTHFSEEEHKIIPSGETVYQTLYSLKDQLSLNLIEDIQIGYELKTRHNVSNSNILILEPEWYINFGGSWRPFSYFNDMLINRGVE